jgi:hypothetical protein
MVQSGWPNQLTDPIKQDFNHRIRAKCEATCPGGGGVADVLARRRLQDRKLAMG